MNRPANDSVSMAAWNRNLVLSTWARPSSFFGQNANQSAAASTRIGSTRTVLYPYSPIPRNRPASRKSLRAPRRTPRKRKKITGATNSGVSGKRSPIRLTAVAQ